MDEMTEQMAIGPEYEKTLGIAIDEATFFLEDCECPEKFAWLQVIIDAAQSRLGFGLRAQRVKEFSEGLKKYGGA